MGPAGKAWVVTCGRRKAPTHHPGLQSGPKPQGPRTQTFPAKQTSGAQPRGGRWPLSWLFCGSYPTEPGPLGRAGSTVLSPKVPGHRARQGLPGRSSGQPWCLPDMGAARAEAAWGH